VSDSVVKPVRARCAAQTTQQGISLLFALLALVAMLLAAVALVRSVDSGALVLGNLGFKQEATSAADIAAERARSVLVLPPFDLTNDGPAGSGYYATSQDALDPTGRLTTAAKKLAVIDWGDPDSCACLNTVPATCSVCRQPSNEVSPPIHGGKIKARYLITRLCPAAGAMNDANACAKPASTAITQAASKNAVQVGAETTPDTVIQVPYYRVIVRTVGARGAVSFTETIIY
jgi:type IV pilus assembly protein PilX